ncbi:MAG: helix-turn-helix transcriptional regulator [Actinomycetota bacterium]|nr:helix-turn-helix transcriptional regulator [Actinomycetota bacterium]
MAANRGASALEWALAQVGDRWSLLIVHALLGGAKRFGELSEALAGIAPNILSQRLKHLERAGIVVSEPYSSRPARFAYDLTASGRELAGALHLLAQWGSGRSEGEGVQHEACGTAMEPRWWCPTCERAVDDAEDDELRFV